MLKIRTSGIKKETKNISKIEKMKEKLESKYDRPIISCKELCREADFDYHTINIKKPEEIYGNAFRLGKRWFFTTEKAATIISSSTLKKTYSYKNYYIK